MKKDVDEVGVSYLSKLIKLKNKQNSNQKRLERLKEKEYLKDIGEAIYDHEILSGNIDFIATEKSNFINNETPIINSRSKKATPSTKYR